MYLSIYLSIYLSNYLSIYLSIHLDERYDSSAYYRVLPGDLPALCPGGARPSHRHPPRQSGDQVPSGSRYISICLTSKNVLKKRTRKRHTISSK